LEVVRLFLARDGVEIDQRSKSNRSPLSYASERGHLEIVRLFLARNGIVTVGVDELEAEPKLVRHELPRYR